MNSTQKTSSAPGQKRYALHLKGPQIIVEEISKTNPNPHSLRNVIWLDIYASSKLEAVKLALSGRVKKEGFEIPVGVSYVEETPEYRATVTLQEPMRYTPGARPSVCTATHYKRPAAAPAVG